MAEKTLISRIISKHDVEKNWVKATGFTPLKGEVIVYDRDDNITDASLKGQYSYARIKIGDGVQNVNALPFVNDVLREALITQIGAVDEKVDTISALVGDEPVSDQINSAIDNSGHIKSTGDTMTGPLKTMGLTSNAIQGVGESKIVILPSVPYDLIDETHTSESYFEQLLVWICDNYPEYMDTTFIGTARPNSLGSTIIHIYNTSNRDADSGLPQYAGGIYIPLPSSSTIHHFGTYAYTFYWNSTLMANSPYAGSTSAGGAANSAKQLTTARTVALGEAVASTATAFDGTENITIPVTSVKEAYLSWGGKSIAGRVSPLDMAMSEEFNANRLAFMPADDIDVEYSTDGGSTWTDYGLTDVEKQSFVTKTTNLLIGKGQNSPATVNDQVRVTITASESKLYFSLKKILLHVSTTGATGCSVLVEGATVGEPDAFSTIGSYAISGWSGWNSIPCAIQFGGAASQTTHTRKLRFTFSISGVSSTAGTGILTIYSMRMFGDNVWATSGAPYSRNGHMYSFDMEKNVTFPAKVTALSFTGSLAGNATSATKAVQDGDGDVITSKYATKTELDDVSSLVGDTAVAMQISNAMTGTAVAPIQLAGGDLNSVRTPGHYFAGGSSGITNIPDGVDAFGVEVYRSAGGYITQELTSGNQLTGKKFIRTYNNSTWSEWHVIYTSAYPQVHVGPTEPTDPNVQVWINTSEEGTGVVPVLPRITTISLPAANWTGSSAPYSQIVSVNTATSATKIDLQPTVAQITSLQNDDIALMAENTNGTVKIYAFGGKPSADMTMQALLVEASYV